MLVNHRDKSKSSSSPQSLLHPKIRPWANAATIGSVILLVYILSQLGTVVEASTKTVVVSINGLADTYTTDSLTVGGLLNELNLSNQQVTSVTPVRSKILTNQSFVAITTQPTARNTIVATNMQDTIKRVADLAKQKAAEAQLKAEEALVAKSPTYHGTASWYSFGTGMNAASTQFPRGTRLRVIAVNSGKAIVITINDYGPEAWTDVMLDLNKPAFAKLAPLGAGKIPIKYYRI
ncbi:MAG: RlpA-like double-psi beta-barrel domain-containing protein [Patescibacteria group bacterium]